MLRRLWLSLWLLLYRPRLVCAWCDRLIARRGLLAGDEVSHGICARCVPLMRRSVRSSGLEVAP